MLHYLFSSLIITHSHITSGHTLSCYPAVNLLSCRPAKNAQASPLQLLVAGCLRPLAAATCLPAPRLGSPCCLLVSWCAPQPRALASGSSAPAPAGRRAQLRGTAARCVGRRVGRCRAAQVCRPPDTSTPPLRKAVGRLAAVAAPRGPVQLAMPAAAVPRGAEPIQLAFPSRGQPGPTWRLPRGDATPTPSFRGLKISHLLQLLWTVRGEA